MRLFSGILAVGILWVSVVTQADTGDGKINQVSDPVTRAPSASGLATPMSRQETGPPSADPIDRSLLQSYLVDQSAFTLIDARSLEEYEAGHVNGAVNVSIDRVSRDNEDLPEALDRPILVYCKTNRRSTAVHDALLALGYSNVRVLPAEQLMFHDNLIVFNCGA